MAGAPQGSGRGTGFGLLGFLLMCFAVLGLTGLLAAHVAPLPLERALQREALLDEALAAGRAGNTAALEALRVRLGDSAQAILPAGADFEAKVAAERTAMRARRLGEAEATATRLRWMLILVTLLAGGFGSALMLAVIRNARREEGEVAPGRELR
jgi:hypothetical protein